MEDEWRDGWTDEGRNGQMEDEQRDERMDIQMDRRLDRGRGNEIPWAQGKSPLERGLRLQWKGNVS